MLLLFLHNRQLSHLINEFLNCVVLCFFTGATRRRHLLLKATLVGLRMQARLRVLACNFRRRIRLLVLELVLLTARMDNCATYLHQLSAFALLRHPTRYALSQVCIGSS